ncbi:metallophosphoesterase [Nanoarchaeota archaeon]
MRIGLISDTHDNVENIIKAVKKFSELSVDFVIHLGDVVAPATLKYFKGLKMKLVLGNCDCDKAKFESLCGEYGFDYLGAFSELEVDGKKIYLMHHDPDRFAKEKIGHYDYIFHGHTHRKRDEVVKGTRIVNPGAHYYHTEGTVAVVDVPSGSVEFFEV